MVQPVANPDVWAEILQYFRISFAGDNEDDIHYKRRIILSVALICSQLVNVGLNELWRTMTTLEPAARLFGGAFRFKEEKQYWDIDASSGEINRHVMRLQSYLCRIRYLHFEGFPDNRERALWRDLPISTTTSFLCPNLKGLYIRQTDNAHVLMYDFFPLLSPSLVEVDLCGYGNGFDDLAAVVLFSILKRHNVQLVRLTYRGYVPTRLLRHITQFSSLSSLSIEFCPRPDDGMLLEETHIESLYNLTRLENLWLYIDQISEGLESAFGAWVASLEALSTLYLHGTWEKISRSIFGSVVFKSVRSVRLSFAPSERGPSGTDLFSYTSLAFPALRSLTFYSENPILTTPITIKDIKLLKERRMESFVLGTGPIALSSANIIELLLTWPTLKELQVLLFWDDTMYEAKDILFPVSVHGVHLQRLRLPLDLSSLVTELPLTFSPVNCPLRQLEISTEDLFEDSPDQAKKKHIVVRNLITLFPRLDTLEVDDDVDLQFLLDTFQDIIRSTPPQRPDRLFYYD